MFLNIKSKYKNKYNLRLSSKSGAGFTVIEIILTLSVLTALLLLAAPMLVSFLQNPKQLLISMDNIDQARIIASNFTNELRNAVTGNDGSYPLNKTDDAEIIFYSNFGSAAPAVNRIRYYISGSTLYKGVTVPAGNPLSYNLSSEVVRPVLSGLANAAIPAFYYYDGNYDGSTGALAQPVNINQVKFAKINLLVPKQTTPQGTSNFSMTTGAAIRTLKDNLGN